MSEESETRIDSAADLIKKGAVLLREACPRCGGLQVRYKGRMVCINCGDLSSTAQVEAIDAVDVVSSLRDLITRKIRDTTAILTDESDLQKQSDLVSLLLKYLDLLDKISKAIERRG